MIIDSYSETNYDTLVDVGTYSAGGQKEKVGQTFTLANTFVPSSCKFYLKKVSLTWSYNYAMQAIIYAVSGGVPTGSALITSTTLYANDDLSTDLGLIEFTFSTTDFLPAGDYCVCVYVNGGGSTRYVQIGVDGSSPSHDGAYVDYVSSWSEDDTQDTCFYLYGTPTGGSKAYITINATAQKTDLYWLETPTVNIQAPLATHVKVKSPEYTAGYTATVTPAPTAGQEVYRLVEIEEGDATVCQNVAEELIDRWSVEQKSVIGKIPLNVTLDFKRKIHVNIPWAGIDEEMILQRKVHNIKAKEMFTEVTLGDIILSDEELIARIIDDLL